MKTVILSAGRGQRLEPVTDVFPKPTVKVNGRPLVLHNFNSLKRLGVKNVALVVGYKADIVFEKIGHGINYDIDLSYIHNEEWERGNGMSLLKAKEFVGDENFLLMMSDHVFEEDILRELIKTSKKMDDMENVIVSIAAQKKSEVRPDILNEATKLLVNDDGNVVKFGKKLTEYNYIDIGAFVCKPVIFTVLEGLKNREGEISVSDCMNWLIDKGYKIMPTDVTGKSWQDFDFIEDLSK